MNGPSVTASLRDTGTPPIPEAKEWLSAYDCRHGPSIDLSQAAPAYPPPGGLLGALAEAAADPATAAYGPIRGEGVLRGAYAAEISSIYGAAIPDDAVAILAGCNQAFVAVMMSIAAAGDEILIPAPWYFNHKMALDMLGIHATALPCRAGSGFVPDVAEAAALLSPRTRGIVLVTPNNPTGAIYPPEVIAAFSELAAARGLWLVIDETYRDFMPEAAQRPHGLFAAAGGAPAHVVQLYSFSKAFALPGYRLGAVAGPPSLMGPFAKVLDTVQICAARVGQIAVGRSMAGLAGWREENRAMIARRAAAFRRVMAEAQGWRIGSVGAYFAYAAPPKRAGGAAAAARRLAQETGVLMLPGSFFGPGQEEWLRVAFANASEEALGDLPRRLATIA
jgi:aspartate/methionine/tyrosine aminotransferase